MSGSSREALRYAREWSGGPPRCSGVVKWSSRKSGSSREVLSCDREWSGGPPECPRVVGRFNTEVREWSGGPPKCAEWPKVLPEVRE